MRFNKHMNGKAIHRKGSLRLHIIPILVWLGAVACVVVLVSRRSHHLEILGIAQGQVHQIAATCTGRLRSVPVQLFEKVTIGQTLAVVDTVLENETLEAQLGTIQAEIAHLTAQLSTIQDDYIAEKTDRQINYAGDKRRFAVDVENSRLRILELKALLASDRVLLGDLNTEFIITQRLLEQDVIESYELEKARVQYETLSKKIEENEHLLKQAESDLKQSLQRYDEYLQHKPYYSSVDSALNVINKAIKVQEQLMNELLERFKPLELKSPINGVVIPILGNRNEVALRRPGENVMRRAGEVITAGDPIFAVAETEPSEIVAYVNERQLVHVQEGMVVELVKNNEPAQIARSQITYVSPVVEQMPERLWLNSIIPQWGRVILIRIHPDLKLVSGELVKIRLL